VNAARNALTTGGNSNPTHRPPTGGKWCRVSDSAIRPGQSQTGFRREKSSVMSATINAWVPIASPLVFAERLIALAIEADQSGFSAAARRLVATAHSVLDRSSAPPSSRPRRGPSLADCERLAISRLAAH
jgi:hypothetical protein